MKKYLLYLLMPLLCSNVMAQVFSPYGYVFFAQEDTPLMGVTAMADDGSKHNVITDERGYFILKDIPTSTKTISFVLIGYKTLSINITDPEKQKKLGKIRLQENQSDIDEVVIVAAAPIATQMGDTVQYNASAFKANPDADADDLIAKMPGVVIQDGKVEAQGETISKVYVDSNLFFGSNPLEALASIPADAIESIQIFDEISDEARESGIEDEEPTKAINIVTKSKRDKNTIVKLEGSAGTNTYKPNIFHYLGGGNISFFSKKTRFTITGIANNINSQKFGANSDPSSETLDAYGNVKGTTQGIKTTEGVGFNFTHKANKYDFSTSYVYNHVWNNIVKTTLRDYYAVEGSYDERLTNIFNVSDTYSATHRVNMRIQYKLTEKNSITFSPGVSFQDYDYLTTNTTSIVQDGDSTSLTTTQYDHTSKNFNTWGSIILSQSFEKKGRKASFSTNYNIRSSEYERTQEQTYKLTDFTNHIEYADSTLTNKLLGQESDGNTIKFRATYSEQIIPEHNLTLNAQYNKSITGIDKINNNYNYTDQDYTDANLDQYTLYSKLNDSYGAGLSYSTNLKKLYVNAGFTILKSDLGYLEELPDIETTYQNFIDYQPYINLKYKKYKKFFVRFYYRGFSVLPDITYMQDVINTDNEYNLKVGNPELKQGYKHTFSFNFNKTNAKKSTSLYMSLWANTIDNYVTTSTELAPDKLVVNGTTYYPVDGAILTHRINMDGYFWGKTNIGYSFTAKPIKCNVNLNASYAYVCTPAYYYQAYNSEVHTATFRVGVVSNISPNIDFNIYSSTAYSYTHNTRLSDYSYLNQTIYMASNFIVWKSLVINSEITWRYYQGIGNYTAWNLGIGKKFLKRKNAEARLTAYDLLNQTSNIQRYSKTSYIESVTTNTLGRYVLLKLSYRFNTMSMPPKPKTMDGENERKISVDELKKIEQSGTTK